MAHDVHQLTAVRDSLTSDDLWSSQMEHRQPIGRHVQLLPLSDAFGVS